jgi:hypothetical protein
MISYIKPQCCAKDFRSSRSSFWWAATLAQQPNSPLAYPLTLHHICSYCPFLIIHRTVVFAPPRACSSSTTKPLQCSPPRLTSRRPLSSTLQRRRLPSFLSAGPSARHGILHCANRLLHRSCAPLRDIKLRIDEPPTIKATSRCYAENTCCKRMFQVFQMFRSYVASVSYRCCKSRSKYVAMVVHICCKCFIRMLHMFAMVFRCFRLMLCFILS